MDNIVTDLKIISEKSSLNQDDFEAFKLKVKKIPVGQFDEMAHPIVKDITSKIDCKKCGNCCRFQEPGVTNEEIDILAQQKNVSIETFKEKYIARDKEGVSFLCVKPCTFLSLPSQGGKECSIYSLRPNSCADFPGLHRPGLKWRMKQVEENYSICPIVFNVVEKLKEIL